MNTGCVRWLSSAMMGAAILAVFIAHAVLLPTAAVAAACCQDCDAKESACYASCEAGTHNAGPGDNLQQCYDDCYWQMYEWTYGCWTNCVYCQPSEAGLCFSCTNYHGLWYWNGQEWVAPDPMHSASCSEVAPENCG